MHCVRQGSSQKQEVQDVYGERGKCGNERSERGCTQLAHAVKRVRSSDTGKLAVQVQVEWRVQLSSVAQSCPMDRSMPGLPVHHQLPESTQTHVH